ncbi:MAG: alpha/beta hydrolase-fold protein [Candidatus Bathyarchaeia archaeon]
MVSNLRFNISFPRELGADPLDGRVLLMISDDDSEEPRFQISGGLDTQLVFGIDVDGIGPEEGVIIDESVLGYPLESISEIPPGKYWVQALLHVYETFHRGDGHTVKLPMDRGEGQRWRIAPGNLLSTPEEVYIYPQRDELIEVTLDQKIDPLPEREDTKYVKHVRVRSELLSEFWGRPWFLEAIILLPEGFDENPDTRYPLVIYHGHHHRMFYAPVQFRENPPDPEELTGDRPVQGSYYPGYDLTEQEYAYKFYRDWTSPDYPRYILVTIQHPTPYYDDSYAVNSENNGPFGDAITYELIPYIEKNFRGIGERWARVLTGGSTGGWESLAAQIFYPDEYNGCWVNCPDPIDFRALVTCNIYQNENAFYYDSKWKKTPKPQRRATDGHIVNTLKEVNRMEHVIGTRGRSGCQWDIWMAVFGPVGEDGYPKLLFDKLTGEIDPSVAEYMRENYDLRYILKRDWEELGPKLKGKIRIYVGDMDNYYLNNAVYLMEEFLERTEGPYYDGIIEYGDRYGHCWSGDHINQYAHSRLTTFQRFSGAMAKHMADTAPPNADTSWKGNWPIPPKIATSEWRSHKIPGWHADKDKR